MPRTTAREFFRVETAFEARIRVTDTEEAARITDDLRQRPSVWSPRDERNLRALAGGVDDRHAATLARSILEIIDQVTRLQAPSTDPPRETQPATIVQLSGGGGRLETPLGLSAESLLELWFRTGDAGTPCVHALVAISERSSSGMSHGFRFEVIHPEDHERVFRVTHEIQRRALREARLGGDEE